VGTNEPPDKPKVIALDPGVRTFLTGYSPSEEACYEFSPQAIQRLCRLSSCIDKLTQRMDTDPDLRHKQRLRLRRARLRIYQKIRHLVAEVHWKSCDVLVKRFDVIVLPKFGAKAMVQKRHDNGGWKRKIGKNSARRLLLWSHYAFRQKLLAKAKQHGRVLIFGPEAYTSKTCTSCGVLNHTLGSSKVFQCCTCGSVCDRDINGARNILLPNTFQL